jgi:hypothetical protein
MEKQYMKKFIYAALIVMMSLFSTAQATDFYVKSNASGGDHDGTSWTKAWKTIDAIQWGNGATEVGYGDVLHFEKHHLYWWGSLLVGGGVNLTRSGSETLTITGGGVNRPVFSGGGSAGNVITVGTAPTSLLEGHVIIKGIEVTNFKENVSTDANGIYFHYDANGANSEVDDVRITDFIGAGIHVKGADSVHIHDCYIESRDDSSDRETDGIFLTQSTLGTRIYDNEIYIRTRGIGGASHNDCIQMGGTGDNAGKDTYIYRNILDRTNYDEISQTADASALMLLDLDGKVGVYNNFIISAHEVSPIHIAGQGGSTDADAHVYNNTIYTGGIAGNFKNLDELRWKNNIVFWDHDDDGGPLYKFNDTETSTTGNTWWYKTTVPKEFNNNLVFNNTNYDIKYAEFHKIGGSVQGYDADTWYEWESGSGRHENLDYGEGNSIGEDSDPLLNDTSVDADEYPCVDLHVNTCTSPVIEEAWTASTTDNKKKIDIDGTSRSSSCWEIGAHEQAVNCFTPRNPCGGDPD